MVLLLIHSIVLTSWHECTVIMSTHNCSTSTKFEIIHGSCKFCTKLYIEKNVFLVVQ